MQRQSKAIFTTALLNHVQGRIPQARRRRPGRPPAGPGKSTPGPSRDSQAGHTTRAALQGPILAGVGFKPVTYICQALRHSQLLVFYDGPDYCRTAAGAATLVLTSRADNDQAIENVESETQIPDAIDFK